MTIYIPNAGEEYLLRLILGNTGSCVLNIHLYAKSWTTDDCVDVTDQNGGLLQDWFVEANQLGDNSISDNGYAAQTLDGALWNFTTDFDGVTTAEYSTTINFTFTDNSISGVCGYWIESTCPDASSTAIMVEEFTNAPLPIPSYGASISITPRIRLFGGTPNPASCGFIECGGAGAYADCGLISAPFGYIWAMDCNACQCVMVVDPNP